MNAPTWIDLAVLAALAFTTFSILFAVTQIVALTRRD